MTSLPGAAARDAGAAPVPRPVTALVVDDEPQIRRAVRHALATAADGAAPVAARVVEADGAASALAQAAAERPALVVLDLGLPDGDGLAVCRELRAWSDAAVLVLSARDGDVDKAALLDAGADDYLTKPFSVLELQARARALLRRAARAAASASPDGRVTAGELVIDRVRRAVTRAGAPVHLTPTEWALLAELAAHPDRPLTHHHLFAAVWPGRAYGDAQAYLRVYVGHLRRKLEADPVRPRHLRTESGVGYRWVP